MDTDRHPHPLSEIRLLPAGGSIARGVHYYPVRAFFEDTDLSGVVYHANYLRWFERARSDLLRLLNIDQRAAQEAGEGVYAVSDIQIRYKAPAKLDDAVLIETRAGKIGRASCILRQTARLMDESAVQPGVSRDLAQMSVLSEMPVLAQMPVLSQMEVRVGFITPDGRPRRQPAEWVVAFEQFAADAAAASTPDMTETRA